MDLLLKEYVDYKCQFPGCNSQIPDKKRGVNYVEVAHIKAVSEGGKSTIGNLIVLCPNHHKEFDLGERNIFEINSDQISGKLNNKNFQINLFNNYSYKIIDSSTEI
ncbi:putative restriction endonuclease [Chryseobacterium sp. SORGH_AS 447]|uniref:HNH endonuclease n=1 Tax=Chryseobacterium sp. SORGH_AS_0447 TaxID=3041769 RepID=UPI0027841992|nr:HNH endonuclease [Chryseobacterium sp. SORGH_AS_0447]MDQ1162767.1 putative restriction endonuclease [Chryseobacterium sp. SORGH_AS_0447]